MHSLYSQMEMRKSLKKFHAKSIGPFGESEDKRTKNTNTTTEKGERSDCKTFLMWLQLLWLVFILFWCCKKAESLFSGNLKAEEEKRGNCSEFLHFIVSLFPSLSLWLRCPLNFASFMLLSAWHQTGFLYKWKCCIYSLSTVNCDRYSRINSSML